MNKFVLISFYLLVIIITQFSFAGNAVTQNNTGFENTGGALTETDIIPEKPAQDKKPLSLTKKKPVKKIPAKPIVKTAAGKKANNIKPPVKPSSLDKTYTTKMLTKKTVTVKSAASLQAKKPAEKKSKKHDNITAKTARKPVIVIDPGHGGKDRGTMGRLGTKEKDITLSYGLALKNELEKTGKYKVVMTRSDDRFIELRQRVSIARKAGGDVMISIHADSNPDRTTRGFSVYTLSSQRAHDEAKKLLAESDQEEVVKGAKLKGESKDVKEAIIGFAQDSTKDVSDDFAQTVAKNLGRRIQSLKKHNRQGSLAVLTGADIPSVLIELGYLSNDYEERLLRTEEQKQKIVGAITNSVNEYFTKFKMVF